MNHLFFTISIISIATLTLVIQRGFFSDKISAMTPNIGYSTGLDNSPAPTIDRNLVEENSLQQQIPTQLYNSISAGMTYEEVSSIIGWEGVLIYETQIDLGARVVTSKVYQWNYDDFNWSNTVSTTTQDNRLQKNGASSLNLYQNLTLEFQDNVLTEFPVVENKL